MSGMWCGCVWRTHAISWCVLQVQETQLSIARVGVGVRVCVCMYAGVYLGFRVYVGAYVCACVCVDWRTHAISWCVLQVQETQLSIARAGVCVRVGVCMYAGVYVGLLKSLSSNAGKIQMIWKQKT